MLIDHFGMIIGWNLTSMKSFGTTDMATALTKAMALFTAPSAGDRILWLTTDGQVGNEDQLLRQVEQQARNCRIFTVGIGRAVNASLLERLATYGGGHCELVESQDALSAPVYCRLGAPLLTDLRLEPALEDVTPDPANLFPGVPLRISGRFSGSVPAQATVTGRTPDGQTFRQTLRPVETSDGAIHTLWARARALDLEHRFVVDPDGDPGLADASTAFSLNHGILGRFTAFLAMDHEVIHPGGELRQVVQAVELPLPWWAEAGDFPPLSQEMLSQWMSARAVIADITKDMEELPAVPAMDAFMIAALRAGLVQLEARGDPAAALVTEGRNLIALLETGGLEETRLRLTDWLRRVRERLQPAMRDRRRFWWR
jgi:Ca-activated chloride channel family protein